MNPYSRIPIFTVILYLGDLYNCFYPDSLFGSMESISGFLVKSKITSEVKNLTKELGFDDDGQDVDEERKKRDTEDNYRKQQAKTDEKMKQIEAGRFFIL